MRERHIYMYLEIRIIYTALAGHGNLGGTFSLPFKRGEGGREVIGVGTVSVFVVDGRN